MIAAVALQIGFALCVAGPGMASAQGFSLECRSCSARLDVTLSKATYEVGEPIFVQARITNTGRVPIPIPVSSDTTGRHDGYQFTVTHADGGAVADPFGGAVALLKAIVSFPTIAPGAVSTRPLMLNYWIAPLEPGSYVLRGVFVSRVPAQIRAESTAISFDIVPTSSEQRGRRVTQLTDALARGDDAQQVAPLLGFTGDPRARDPLIDLLYSPNSYVRTAAIDALLLLEPRDVMRGLLDAIRTRGPRDRLVEFVMGPVTVDQAEMIGMLRPWLGSSNQDAREAALRGLGFFNDPPSPQLFPALAAMLKDAAPAVRHQAAVAVGAYRDADALAALRPAVRDSHPDVREQATIAVGWIAASRPAGDAIRARAIELLQEIAGTTGREREQARYWLSQSGVVN